MSLGEPPVGAAALDTRHFKLTITPLSLLLLNFTAFFNNPVWSLAINKA